RVRYLDRGDWRSVVTKLARGCADLGPPSLDFGAESHALQVTNCIGGDIDARPDLAQCGRLFIDRHSKSLRDQRIRGKQAADAAADDRYAWPRCHHRSLMRLQCWISRLLARRRQHLDDRLELRAHRQVEADARGQPLQEPARVAALELVVLCEL